MLDCWAQMLRLQSNMQRASAIVCKSMQGEIPPVKDNSPALYTIVEPCSFYKKNIKICFPPRCTYLQSMFSLVGWDSVTKKYMQWFFIRPRSFCCLALSVILSLWHVFETWLMPPGSWRCHFRCPCWQLLILKFGRVLKADFWSIFRSWRLVENWKLKFGPYFATELWFWVHFAFINVSFYKEEAFVW